MVHKAYLTIDDSPSAQTDDLTDFLAAHNIQGQFFCRGDRMDQTLDPVVRAIEKGMVIANHSYSHRPAGDLSYAEIVAEIEATERLIEKAYRAAGALRTEKYFRFPYLDRGDGDRLERRFNDIIAAVSAGREISLPGCEKVKRLQDYLKHEGFTQPYHGVTHPLYQSGAIAGWADCLITYSSNDWMLTARHKGQWEYKNLDDLKNKMEDDPWLCREGGAQVVLFHDDPEIGQDVIALIGYMLDKGFVFLRLE